jgi:subtilisin-like proprotein convertase family protein
MKRLSSKRLFECIGILFLVTLLHSNKLLAQEAVGIGTTSPDPSSVLHVESNSAGVLIPRMDQSAREDITNPAEGLTVYDVTTKKFWYYNGVKWVTLAVETSGPVVTDVNLTNNNSFFIDDEILYTPTITVESSGFFNEATNIEVCIDISHTLTEDLIISLVSPSGKKIVLTSDNGGGQNYSITCFNPTATNPISNFVNTNPFNGTFLPEQPFSTFNGDPLGGNWVLEIFDQFEDFTGTFNSWSLSIMSADETGVDRVIADDDFDTRIDTEQGSDEDAIRMYTNGVEQMTITSVGNIGLGRTNPNIKLDVFQNNSGGNDTLFRFRKATTSDFGDFALLDGSGASRFSPLLYARGDYVQKPAFQILGSSDTDSGFSPMISFNVRHTSGPITNRNLFQWQNDGQGLMTMDKDGQLGIGTSSPMSTLHVGATNEPSIRLQSGSNSGESGRLSFRDLGSSGVDIFYDGTDNVEKLFFERVAGNTRSKYLTLDVLNGHFGIGNSSPTVPLDVYRPNTSGLDTIARFRVGANDPASSLFVINGTNNSTRFAPALYGRNDDATVPAFYLIGGSSDDTGIEPLTVFDSRLPTAAVVNRPLFQWRNFAVPQMTMNANGDLGIGVSDPTAKLDIDGRIRMRDGAQSGFVAVSDANGNMTWSAPNFSAGWTNSGNDLYQTNQFGNIGIGLTDPMFRLDVRGFGNEFDTIARFALIPSEADEGLFIRNSLLNGPSIDGRNNSSNKPGLSLLGNVETDDLALNSAIMEFNSNIQNVTNPVVFSNLFQWKKQFQVLMTMDAEGQLGIGTNNPRAKLDVRGPADIEGSAIIRGSADIQGAPTIQLGSRSFVGKFENTDNSDLGSSGLAIKIGNPSDPINSSDNDYITFFNGNSQLTGAIEGFNLNDDQVAWPGFDFGSIFSSSQFPVTGLSPITFDNDFITRPSLDWIKLEGDITLLADVVTFLKGDPLNWQNLDKNFENFSGGVLDPVQLFNGITDNLSQVQINELNTLICWALSNGFESLLTTNPFDLALATTILAQTQICKDNGGVGGVTFVSSGADYAEWLPRADVNEGMHAGHIVGVRNGKISKVTEGADQIFAISTNPLVLGNVPAEGKESEYEKVGFMGQVPVLVKGVVKEGDYILASGNNDGFGRAVAPEDIELTDITEIVGRAWSPSQNDLMGYINVAVGLNRNDLVPILKKQQEKVEQHDEDIASLKETLKVIQAKL